MTTADGMDVPSVVEMVEWLDEKLVGMLADDWVDTKVGCLAELLVVLSAACSAGTSAEWMVESKVVMLVEMLDELLVELLVDETADMMVES